MVHFQFSFLIISSTEYERVYECLGGNNKRWRSAMFLAIHGV